MDFEFRQIEGALAATFEIADDRRSAFVHRLQHIQKKGFPSGTNTGRGRAAVYRVEHLFLLAVLLELGQLGYTPARAAKLITDNLIDLGGIAYGAASRDPAKAFDHPIVLYMRPAGLGDLVVSSTADHIFLHGDFERAQEDFAWAFKQGQMRMAFFSLSALIQKLATIIMAGTDQPIIRFYEELAAWGSAMAAKNFEDLFVAAEKDR